MKEPALPFQKPVMGPAPELSVVIPVFCEGDHIAASVSLITREAGAAARSFEVVLIDDGSKDNTWPEIYQLSADDPRIRCLRFSRNFGKEAAIWAGLEAARGRGVIIMDGDLQHPPDLIPRMVEMWEEGYEVVDAVKLDRGREGFFYKSAVTMFSWMLCRLSGFDLYGASDYKLLDRKVVTALLRLEERQTFFRGLTEWMGFRHGRVPMKVNARAGGRSAWSVLRLVRLALTALTSFSTIFLYGVTLLGMTVFLLGSLFSLFTLYRWISGEAVEGFTTVILLQLLIGGSIMVALGIIGEYLARIYWEAKRRPRYVVMEEQAQGLKAAQLQETSGHE